MQSHYDVVVVGAGNAALCAALSASEKGASVLVLERSPEAEAGGNTAFTAGAMRTRYDNNEDLLSLMPDLSQEEIDKTDFGTYTGDEFFDDIVRVTDYRCDPDLTSILVEESLPTLQWMHSKGVKFMPIYGRQAYEIDGKFVFWGGLTVEVNGGGPGLVQYLLKAAKDAGVDVVFETIGERLIKTDDKVTGIVVSQNGKEKEITAGAVILGAGGFEANAQWRAQYLGQGWDLAKVRGSQYNDGKDIQMALDIGAMPWGNWSGCHAVGWDLNAPQFGDLRYGDSFQKHSYPLGIMVNANGERFVDEGADFRNYTYAKYGRAVLEQPSQFAWQVFDSKVSHLLRDEYRQRHNTKVTANTLEELAEKLDGVNAQKFLQTVEKFNNSVKDEVPFNPNVKDGRSALNGTAVPKSNWANKLDQPPYEAYAITCGITFTFGGLKIDTEGNVIDSEGKAIPGLYGCGELVGGIFYFNYPGGSGLTAGSVFGKISGESAANAVLAKK